MGIEEGSVEGVPYYRWENDDASVHLVLLHGARFTKEDWKTSNLLDRFGKIPKLTTSALDLDAFASYKGLKPVLEALGAPSTSIALVTPSASGNTMKTWLESDPTELKRYVHYWIPVAPGCFSSVPKGKLSSLQEMSILSVHGDGDYGGKRVSERLKESCNATVQEISGGHPCYLDSPDDFVQHVRSFLQL